MEGVHFFVQLLRQETPLLLHFHYFQVCTPRLEPSRVHSLQSLCLTSGSLEVFFPKNCFVLNLYTMFISEDLRDPTLSPLLRVHIHGFAQRTLDESSAECLLTPVHIHPPPSVASFSIPAF